MRNPRNKRRTAKKMTILSEQQKRALYVRLPHKITNKEEIQKLFNGEFEVKLFRQASRHCVVVFPTREDLIRNLNTRHEKVDGKKIVLSLYPSHDTHPPTEKISRKKVVMPEVKDELHVTQKIFISNVKCGTKAHEIKEALEGCVAVTMLKPYSHNFRSALARMEDIKIAGEYLTEAKEWPVVNGHKLILKPDTRIKHKKTNSKMSNKKDSKSTIKKKTDKRIEKARNQKVIEKVHENKSQETEISHESFKIYN